MCTVPRVEDDGNRTRGVDGAISNVGEAIQAKNSENRFEEKKERRDAWGWGWISQVQSPRKRQKQQFLERGQLVYRRRTLFALGSMFVVPREIYIR